MEHPVFYSKRSLVIYLAVWTAITAGQVAFLYSFYLDNLGLAIGDAAVFNILFALLGLAVWYPVHFTQPGRNKVINLIINHITSLIIVLLIWISLGNFILSKAIPEQAYQEFLNEAVPWRIISGVFFYFILVLIYYLIKYYNDLHERQMLQAKIMGSLKEAELNLLKSQINPHFLFNSLNSVSSLIITDPEKAREMIIKLSDFLRYTVSMESDKFTSLEREIDNIRKYLEIEKVRFGNKLQFEFQIKEECLKQKLPLMILQPLFENSIKHGVYESSETILINTLCTQKDGFMEISIRNNFEPGPSSKKGAGLGLKNIKERLKLLYQSDQLMKIEKSENSFEVKLLIPVNHEG
ncbi:MAG: histidine kinase [Bacteroidales bacterium]|nr:histidine kinase [Bacteroidales bacterium]MCF8388272.1 histidine kinase [Bacteroidales bacterium]MCF8399130.1 histidine kinase [Bacteroidales bacterium]